MMSDNDDDGDWKTVGQSDQPGAKLTAPKKRKNKKKKKGQNAAGSEAPVGKAADSVIQHAASHADTGNALGTDARAEPSTAVVSKASDAHHFTFPSTSASAACQQEHTTNTNNTATVMAASHSAPQNGMDRQPTGSTGSWVSSAGEGGDQPGARKRRKARKKKRAGGADQSWWRRWGPKRKSPVVAAVLAVVLAYVLMFEKEHLPPLPTQDEVASSLSNITASVSDMMADWAAFLSMNLSLDHLNNQAASLITDWWVNRTELAQRLNISVSELAVRVLSQLPSKPGASDAGALSNATRPGLTLAAKGYQAKHPVVIVPGFVTSQLELWQGQACAAKYFRQRMWGTMTMMQAFLLNKPCWFSHLELDPATGLDPPGVRLRAAQGMEAVDQFVQGYWVWGKLIEALADVGYTPNTLATLSYDWRLSVPNMELRDSWFTRSKNTIEIMVNVTGEKCVMASHSYGENVARSFIHWVEAVEPGWLDRYLEAHVSIAGPPLGAPKAVTALLSGEARDTAQLGTLATYLTDRMMPRPHRAKLFRSWGSLMALFPVGGPKVWGNGTWAPDDPPELTAANKTYGAMVVATPLRPATAAAAAAAASDVAAAAKRSCPSVDLGAEGLAGDCTAEGGREGGGGEGRDNGLDHDDLRGQYNVSTTGGGGVGTEGTSGWEKSRVPGSLSEGGEQSAENMAAEVSSGAAASAGMASSILNWFTASDESDAGDVLDLSRMERLHVSHAAKTALRVAGPQRPAQFESWGAVSHPRYDKGTSVWKVLLSSKAKSAPSATASGVPLPLYPNALTNPLPHAPRMKMYCLYGIGVPTERAYHYLQPDDWSFENTTTSTDSGNGEPGQETAQDKEAVVPDDIQQQTEDITQPFPSKGYERDRTDSNPHVEGTYEWRINTGINDPDHNLINGVMLSEGDLTIPLLSLGGMCQGGWRSKRLNPAGIKVTTKEYKHNPVVTVMDPRGGPGAASHIDILGNEEMLSDVLLIATGAGDQVQERVMSHINEYVKQIPWEDPDGWE